ncbi:MAG: hypothetical protein JRF59_13795 [Deltaproteobacteria bacterium]|nr:hypothetical protein [Deltaproteobacteria bacterium]MBW1925336.1 hypothetical protein [Deltaproteobacteria bacterium]MBW1951123.1 hypothetical protein [Deltaproteobacteria bacterium]MBW2008661.1 hypothetical protein [Deltaproteobacteria bacterium]MBW2102846.1 hypothetical protein [Deltaproteobacteria bacterium]
MSKEKLWKAFQQHMGYTDEELALFRANPRNTRLVEETPEFMKYKIIAEVIESHGCHSLHRVGDRIVMNGNGQLIRDECPEVVCIWALQPLAGIVGIIFERFAEHLDPNQMLFNRVHCHDVGLRCGGWGQILMKVYVEPC